MRIPSLIESRHLSKCLILPLLLASQLDGKAQSQFSGLEHLFTPPKTYVVSRAEKGPIVDGALTDAVWQQAQWSDLFTDIEGDRKPAPRYGTRMKMLWNDTHLFIAAELEEPHVWANLKHRDEIVFHDNDFEVFIDPDNDTHQYFEIEVNALNTIFDLFLPKPYRNNSGALISWDAPGLESAVHINGSLNNASDTDRGWTVEMAIPLHAITTGNDVKVPREGDFWRINFSRVEWDTDFRQGKYVKRSGADGRPLPEHNWVWSPQGVINMHYPERWGYLQFSAGPVAEKAPIHLIYTEQQRKILWLIYYRQKEFYARNRQYAATLADLGVSDQVEIDGVANKVFMDSGLTMSKASISSGDKREVNIDHFGQVN